MIAASARAETEDSSDPAEAEQAGALSTNPDQQNFQTHPDARAESVAIDNADGILHRENRLGFNYPALRGVLRRAVIEIHQITGRANWLTYDGRKSIATAELQPSQKLNVVAAIGSAELTLNQFQNTNFDLTKNLALWRLQTTFTPWQSTHLRVEGSDDFAYVGWRDPVSNSGQVLPVQILFAEADTFAISGFELRSSLKRSFINDGNIQQILDHSVLYDVVAGQNAPLSLRAGVGAGSTDFSRQEPLYWSPSHQDNYGLRLIVAKTIATKWNCETRLAYGFHRDRDRERERESTIEGHVSYHASAGWRLNLNGAFLDVNNGGWWKNDLNLNLQVPL